MTERDYAYIKARQKLASELDIKRVLQSLRLFRASLRFLTTPKQRKLLRLQAANNVIEVTPEEYTALKTPLKKKLLSDILKQHNESSDFESDAGNEFLCSLDFEKERPDEKEMELVKGVLPPNERRNVGLADDT
jgi:hypothetical protein